MSTEIRDLARQFAQAELRPQVEAWDRNAALDPGVLDQLGERGWVLGQMSLRERLSDI
ncbi:MAG TPA: acyl-CoA dehydrogenase family protein [Longimicrobiales bacterium]|nr:acyl-CoA dehydrogenase family protein [Longimicrobiales bacterium]